MKAAAPTIWDLTRYYLRLGALGFGGPVALFCSVAFVLPPFLLVTAIAALSVAFEGLTWMQAVFYGIGPAAVALILLSMWGLM